MTTTKPRTCVLPLGGDPWSMCGQPATHALVGSPAADSHLHAETVERLAIPRGRCAEHAAAGVPGGFRFVQWRLVPLDEL